MQANDSAWMHWLDRSEAWIAQRKRYERPGQAKKLRSLISKILLAGLCGLGSAAALADKPATVAARLGYEGCKLSKPLTIEQVMAKDMSGGNGASRAHPDWDELIAKYKSRDQVYFVDCRRVDASSIVAGITLYILVRDGAVIARVAGTS